MSFEFKKFSISHHDQVFKFGTDASLLATWKNLNNYSNILEIGCGSGVITLMMAQRNSNASYQGIDISSQAISLSRKNLSQFPFDTKISFIESSIQEYYPNRKYDLVISNPPFFEDSTKSPSSLKNVTRHTDTLRLSDLLLHAKRLITASGEIHIIYPVRYLNAVKIECNNLNLHVNQITYTRSTLTKPIKRIIVCISSIKKDLIEEELVINGNYKGYSKEVFEMLQPFLLKL